MRRLSFCSLMLLLAVACTKDPLGGPCADNEAVVYKVMAPKDGDNFISQDPTKFLNCDTSICLSTNGSKPYCTKRCGSDSECLNGNDVKMVCKVVTEFGALACRNPANEFCDVDGCKAACDSSCANDDCKTDCKADCEEELCCERNEETGGVTTPASYCAAIDGQIPHDPKAAPIGG